MFKRRAKNLRQIAALAVHKGRYQKALESYVALEQLEPGEAEWPRRVAQMYERLGRREETVAALHRTAAKYEQNGFSAKATAVRTLIARTDPEYAAEQQRLMALAAPSVPPPAKPGRRRMAMGTERIEPSVNAGVKIAWAYHPEISKDERVNLALSGLDPDEPVAEAPPTTEPAGRRRR